jgi:hypothetical protein
MTVRPAAERALLDGPAGTIETIVEAPGEPARGIALLAHPHPLFGGTAENKVVQSLARVFIELRYIAVRPNFRGVGESTGEHDHGIGETDDLIAVAAAMRERFGGLPLVLGGYSFGGFVQTRVAKQLAPQRVVLVAPATGLVTGGRRYEAEPVPTDTIVIHGDGDDTVPLANVLDWARPQELPIVVVPGCDHFFHRKLHVIRGIVARAWTS